MSTLHYSAGTAIGAAGASLTPLHQRTQAESIRGGEPSAEEEFVRLFRDRIRVLVLARTRDAEAAKDVAQDVMLAVVRSLRNGHLRETERLSAFVYGTARNLINNHLRARSRLKEDSLMPRSISRAPLTRSTTASAPLWSCELWRLSIRPTARSSR